MDARFASNSNGLSQGSKAVELGLWPTVWCARFDGDDLVVSSIYDWFEDDFGGTEESVVQHLQRYAEPELRARLSGVTDIDDDEYDWSLNGV